jgi:hypothetical protein
MSRSAIVLKKSGTRNLALSSQLWHRDVLMFINAEMEMPGPHIHGEIAIEHGNFLRLFGELNLKYRSLNARTKNDLAPVLLKQFTQELFETAGSQKNVGILGRTTVKVLNSLRLVHAKPPIERGMDRCLAVVAHAQGR